MPVIIAPGIPSMAAGTYNTAQEAYTSKPGPGSSGPSSAYQIGSGISAAANSVASQLAQQNGAQAQNLASQIAAISGTDMSDYGDYIRQALTISQQNTAQSQQFAREQMAYQQQSDANAMAWSASEANKNREWQERLSNNAHQREVQDLIAAGLNPILAANNGAYTGSGATGQAFSSSGAQGTVDTSASGILGGMAETIVNTASQAAIAELYNETNRYTADMQYAASKLAADTAIYNEHSRNEANRIITAMNNDADIAQAHIHGNATVSAAGASAAATRYAADQNYAGSQLIAEANKYGSDTHLEGTKYSSDSSKAASMYGSDQNLKGTQYSTDYSGYKGIGQHAADKLREYATNGNDPTMKVLGSVGKAYDWLNAKSDQLAANALAGSSYKASGSGRKF